MTKAERDHLEEFRQITQRIMRGEPDWRYKPIRREREQNRYLCIALLMFAGALLTLWIM